MNAIVQEDGFYILQENGYKILTEELQDYRIPLEKSTFTLTGKSVDLKKHSIISLQCGSFALSGKNIRIKKGLGIWYYTDPSTSSWEKSNDVSTPWNKTESLTTNWEESTTVSTLWNNQEDSGYKLLQENNFAILQEDGSYIIIDITWNKL